MYFYFAALRSRELVYYVHPNKSVIVKSGQASGIRVLHENVEVRTDVTALRISIWNAGKESIKPEHLLHPVLIDTKDKVPILEASVQRVGRPVSDIQLDRSEISKGRLGVSWRILENLDGAAIQLIIAGAESTEIVVTGTIEGQGTVRKEPVADDKGSAFLIAIIFLAATVAVFFDHILYSSLLSREALLRVRRLLAVGLFAFAASLIVYSLYTYPLLPLVPTPFGP